MEVLYFLIVLIGAFSIPIVALRLGKGWLIALIPIYLITGNIFAESFLTVFGFFTSLAIPIYSATFLMTDLLSEHYGKKAAIQAVLTGLMGQIIFVCMLFVVLSAPILPDNAQAYAQALGFMKRLVPASIIAYIVSQMWDIFIYHKIMKKTAGKFVWLRNNLSTMTSQLLDTGIFLGIAFYGRPPFQTNELLINFILVTWLFKVAVAALDTPYIYLSLRLFGRKET